MTTPEGRERLPEKRCSKARPRRGRKARPPVPHAPHTWVTGIYLPIGESEGHAVRCPGHPVSREGGVPMTQDADGVGDPAAARMLGIARRNHGREPLLGCDLTAHRDLGYCTGCHPSGAPGELAGWRLLAMAQRGIPRQPSERSRDS